MKKIIAVSNDAGGANIIFSLIKKYFNKYSWTAYVSGPAKKIINNKKISINFIPKNLSSKKINKILKISQPDLILTGTSGQCSLERTFIKQAKIRNIKTASIIDHWVNYRERFGFSGEWKRNLPDYIVVTDKWAYKLALSKDFPKNKLIIIKNPYFGEIIKQAKKMQKKIVKNNDILFISEPAGEELLIAKDLLKIIKFQLKKGIQMKLIIRLHPSEKITKYVRLLNNKIYHELSSLISISKPNKNLLVTDCLKSKFVIGYSSMALHIAFLIGKRVISYNPYTKKRFFFPNKEIKLINSFKELKSNLLRI